jgi:diaminohydroxyphosphoribosylaminopyrimidine deaminase/5-amino-6-(5-phosphoribosylamino)uracil reductase
LGVEVAGLDGGGIRQVLANLAGRGITRLLVEGGPTVWRAFADAGAVDEVVLFMARHGPSSEALAALDRYLGPLDLGTADRRPAGADTMWRLRRTGA